MSIEKILAGGKRPPLTKDEIKQQNARKVTDSPDFIRAVEAYEQCRIAFAKITLGIDVKYRCRLEQQNSLIGLCGWLQQNLPSGNWSEYGRMVGKDWKGSKPPYPNQLRAELFLRRFQKLQNATGPIPIATIVRNDLAEFQQELDYLMRQGMEQADAIANILTCPGLRYQALTYLVFAHHITGPVRKAVIEQFWTPGLTEYRLCPGKYDEAWGLLMPDQIKKAGRSQPNGN